ncbi:initiation factor 4A-like protein isoform X2 [Tasmannia lanceolata]|uniref:initiation factor 4A-like protein isoform X2 n=1 Tax=Tasmannia lanceolata TaxID=3420 RepID=UPI004062BB09
MVIDDVDAPSPSSQFRLQFKMEVLIDLLRVAGQRPSLPIVLCVSSRDELDTVCSAVSNLTFISLACLYSDLADVERALIIEKFRQATTNWNQSISVDLGNDSEIRNEAHKSHVIVITDACLPLLASGETPISGRVLINYELPTKKETYLRRISTCLAADGIVINMVVGGEVVTLKSIEESSGLVIAEMPINISEIL